MASTGANSSSPDASSSTGSAPLPLSDANTEESVLSPLAGALIGAGATCAVVALGLLAYNYAVPLRIFFDPVVQTMSRLGTSLKSLSDFFSLTGGR
jgi:hypothetical protein